MPLDPLPTVGDPSQAKLDELRRLPAAAAKKAVAIETETVFFAELIAAMRKTVPDSGLLPRGPSTTVFEGAFDRSVAESIAASDPLGLVHQMPPANDPQPLRR